MMPILDYIKIGLGLIAGLAIAFLLSSVYWLGVPVLNNYPQLQKWVPVLGDIAVGQVQVRVNDAVAAARHTFAIELQAVVDKTKADAEAESKRQAAIVTTEFNNRLQATQASEAQSSKDLDNALAENEKLRAAAGFKCDRDAGTTDLLRKHGFQVDQ